MYSQFSDLYFQIDQKISLDEKKSRLWKETTQEKGSAFPDSSNKEESIKSPMTGMMQAIIKYSAKQHEVVTSPVTETEVDKSEPEEKMPKTDQEKEARASAEADQPELKETGTEEMVPDKYQSDDMVLVPAGAESSPSAPASREIRRGRGQPSVSPISGSGEKTKSLKEHVLGAFK